MRDAAARAQAPRAGLAAAWFGLAVLVAASTFSLVVRFVLALEAEPLKRSLDLSDAQIGALTGVALTLTTLLASFPISWLADRTDRRRLLAACVLGWTAATAVAGFAQSYAQLFVCSMGIGVAEAVLGPIGFSLIADLFPRRLWIVANYVNTVASLLGAGAGLALSGAVIGLASGGALADGTAPAGHETWRLALMAAAAPGPLIAAAVLLIRRTPPPAAPGGGQGGVLGFFRRNSRSLTGVFAGYGLFAAGHAAFAGWTAVAAVRVFGEPPSRVGYLLGLTNAVASVAGVLGSAAAVRALQPRLGRLAPLAVSRAAAALTVCGAPLCLLAASAARFYLAAGIEAALALACLSAAPTILQFMAPNASRARIITLGGMFTYLLQSFSPVVVGGISDRLASGSGGLVGAMVVVGMVFTSLGAACLGLARRTLGATFADAERLDGAAPSEGAPSAGVPRAA